MSELDHIRECTASYAIFRSNISRVEHFIGASTASDTRLTAEMQKVRTYLKRVAGRRVRNWEAFDRMGRSFKLVKELQSEQEERHASILEWVPVMLVTFTETYLQKVLADLGTNHSSVMSKSKLNIKCIELFQAKSIADLVPGLSVRWAKSIVEDNAPEGWIKNLQKVLHSKKDGYPSGIAEKMKLIWDVRHLVVHAAGIATPDFVAKYPQVGVSAAKRIRVTLDLADSWERTVAEFVVATDEAIVARTGSRPDLMESVRNALVRVSQNDGAAQ